MRTQLPECYPADCATGFKDGDVRGWFWVGAKAMSDPSTKVVYWHRELPPLSAEVGVMTSSRRRACG